ncbi:MAG: alkaline phosphatase [Pseudomonadota bacterium]
MRCLARLNICILAFIFANSASFARADVEPEPGTFQHGANEARARLFPDIVTTPARNIILFIGDGMGLSTVTAGRIYQGQKRGTDGESFVLPFETFPHVALAKTYNMNAQVADSAGTATAMLTGVKTKIGFVNVAHDQPYRSCDGLDEAALEPLSAEFARAGKAIGVVSTTRLTHATPAAMFAKVPDRNWESDVELPDDIQQNKRIGNCRDIASQFVHAATELPIMVALGGGSRAFLPDSAGGRRADGRNLVEEWLTRTEGGIFVSSQQELHAAEVATGPLFGLFSRSHMSYEADRARTEEPSLKDMTAAALSRLKNDPDGYFLMVEGGRIDHAHHAGNAARALEDMRAFSQAIAHAVATTDPRDTLIIVTADHSHVFTIAGYPPRGNPILGLVRTIPETGFDGGFFQDKNGYLYPTLGYGNGPGAPLSTKDLDRSDLTPEKAQGLDYRQPAAIPLGSETHGGEDVPIYAQGPRAYMVRGVMEQNVLYHIMRNAAGMKAEIDAERADGNP